MWQMWKIRFQPVKVWWPQNDKKSTLIDYISSNVFKWKNYRGTHTSLILSTFTHYQLTYEYEILGKK